ncbi:hypothetical protein PTTG_25223, partial [Puccinia triticina 1-1 BBBD Race 1]
RGVPTSHKIKSTLYGLYDLKLRYKEGHTLRPHIDIMTRFVFDLHDHNAFWGDFLRWEKEITDALMFGFGDDIRNRAVFMEIIKGEDQLQDAMSSSPDQGWTSLNTLYVNFDSSSAHKRV